MKKILLFAVVFMVAVTTVAVSTFAQDNTKNAAAIVNAKSNPNTEESLFNTS